MQYTKNTPATIQQHLVLMDTPLIASVASHLQVTPSSNRNLVSTLGTIQPNAQDLSSSTLPHDDDDDEGILAFNTPRLHSLRPVTSNKARSNFRGSRSTSPRVCNFCDESGHLDDSCIKRGLNFWPDWHTKKVTQYNLLHGDKPKRNPNDVPVPPPPRARFDHKPSVRAIQAAVNDATAELDTADPSADTVRSAIATVEAELAKQLDDNVEGDQLMHRAIAVQSMNTAKTFHSPTAHEPTTNEGTEALDLDDIWALNSDTSSEHAADDLDIYDQPVNY